MQNSNFSLGDVNYVLHECGIDGVNSLEDDSNLDLVNALQCLEDACKSIQSKGFGFNSFTVSLSPDMDGFIRWPSEVYTLVATDGTRIVKQKGYLMKPEDNFSARFDSPLEVNVVMKVPLDSTPTPVADYIKATAAEFMNDRWISSDVVEATIGKHKEEAWLNFREWWNDDDNASIFDNQTIQQLNRRS